MDSQPTNPSDIQILRARACLIGIWLNRTRLVAMLAGTRCPVCPSQMCDDCGFIGHLSYKAEFVENSLDFRALKDVTCLYEAIFISLS